MKPASASMITLLTPGSAAKQFVTADLYTWTLISGTVARYTSADKDLTIGGNTFSSANALFRRGKISSSLGIQVPNLSIMVNPRPTDQIGGVGWYAAAVAGNLDGATVLVERFLSDGWANLAPGSLYSFFGKVGGIAFNRGSLAMIIKPPTSLLNRKIPNSFYQTTCVHTLYDHGCGLLKASYTVSGVVASGSTASAIRTNRGEADNYFNLGVITFTSGALNGITRTIDSFTNANGLVSVPLALPSIPAAGTTFTIYPGCNKVYAGDCLGKFANQANFKGTPYVPSPETAI